MYIPITQENFYFLLENEREEECDDAKVSHQLKKDSPDTTPTLSSSSNKKESYAEHGVMDASNNDTEDLNPSQYLGVPLCAVPGKLKSKVSFDVIFIGVHG